MNEGIILVSGLVLGIWVYLVLLHGRYWRERPRKAPAEGPKHWPEVAAIVPARNEAPVVGEAVRSLLRQDYPGKLRIILVDDQSGDGTADIVRAAAEEMGAADRVRVISGKASAGRMDRQDVGGASRHGGARGFLRRREVCLADRCRHRA